MPPLLRTFSYHYRQRYGQTVGKIAVDLGLPCPNRRQGGCLYCRAEGFTPAYLNPQDSIGQQIALGKKKLLRNRFSKYFLYFQQETASAYPESFFATNLAVHLGDSDCLGLILSTRPDALPESFLHRLSEVVLSSGKECLIELGLQSIHGKSLDLLNRNHSYSDFEDAVLRLRRRPHLTVGVHLIFGIPGETEEDMLATVKTVSLLDIQALKLHHLQVIQDTPLHRLYRDKTIALFTEDHYMQFLLRILPEIPGHITLHRLWATAHPAVLVAPKWANLTTILSSRLKEQMSRLDIWQGKNVDSLRPSPAAPHCPSSR